MLLALLVSGQALAGPRLAPAPEAPARHVRLLAPEEAAPAGEEDASRAGRLLAELGLGAVTGAAVAVAAVYAVEAELCIDTYRCPLGLLGAFVGFNLGAALGTYGAGQWLGGHGGYGSPLVGAVVGTTAGLALSFLLAINSPVPFQDPSKFFLMAPALGLTGALIGYELNQTPPARRLRPLLSVSPRGGGLVGLAGAF